MIQTHARGRGFTFLEIMMVVVIIGILAGLVAPRLARRAQGAKVTAARAEIDTIHGAIAQFEMHMGEYPDHSDGLRALVQRPPNDDTKSWQGPYLEKGVPKDPWKQNYQYRYPGEHNTEGFDLSSNGPDKQPGTADDIVNWTVEAESR